MLESQEELCEQKGIVPVSREDMAFSGMFHLRLCMGRTACFGGSDLLECCTDSRVVARYQDAVAVRLAPDMDMPAA